MTRGLLGNYKLSENVLKQNQIIWGDSSPLMVLTDAYKYERIEEEDKEVEIIDKISYDEAFSVSGIEEPYEYMEKIKEKLSSKDLLKFASTQDKINSSPFLTKEEKAKGIAELVVVAVEDPNTLEEKIKEINALLEEKEKEGVRHTRKEIKRGNVFYKRINARKWIVPDFYSKAVITEIERSSSPEIDIRYSRKSNSDILKTSSTIKTKTIKIFMSVPYKENVRSIQNELYMYFVAPKYISLVLPDVSTYATGEEWSGKLFVYEDFLLESIEYEEQNDVTDIVITLKADYKSMVYTVSERFTFSEQNNIKRDNSPKEEIIYAVKMSKDNTSKKITDGYTPFSVFTDRGKERMSYRWISDNKDFVFLIDSASLTAYVTDIESPSNAIDEYISLKKGESLIDNYFYEVRDELSRSAYNLLKAGMFDKTSYIATSYYKYIVTGDYKDDEEVIAMRRYS